MSPSGRVGPVVAEEVVSTEDVWVGCCVEWVSFTPFGAGVVDLGDFGDLCILYGAASFGGEFDC